MLRRRNLVDTLRDKYNLVPVINCAMIKRNDSTVQQKPQRRRAFFRAASLWTVPEKLRLSQATELYRCARSKLSTRSWFGWYYASSVAEPWS